MEQQAKFDVIIVGGSYAGLSAAMSLGRSLRNVLIIDSGFPCNKQTPHSHNFITQDGEKPGVIAAKGKAQVLNYKTVKFHKGLVESGKKTENGFEVITDNGEKFTAKKLVFATGIKDIMPDIKGFSECWGISVIHCPYCHGYEVRNMKTGLLANAERAFHLSSMISNLTNDLTIITNGKADFTSEQFNTLDKHRISVVENEVDEIVHENGYVKSILFRDGSIRNLEAIYAVVPFKQHCEVPAILGCEVTAFGHIKVNDFYKTTIEGVYACGDSTAMMRSVANAVSAGNMTGAMVNKELTDEHFL
ncbi:NAD(P)/FAD-dependent oxidoreductase [Flavobacterium sp. JP2137]|uniref:NAD(P)/FAD-dependent oxidoreductase n=1 Tax=Flavobacterium sp. JP2137 TaxID=3414510 RepID=UPI003D2FE3F6